MHFLLESPPESRGSPAPSPAPDAPAARIDEARIHEIVAVALQAASALTLKPKSGPPKTEREFLKWLLAHWAVTGTLIAALSPPCRKGALQHIAVLPT